MTIKQIIYLLATGLLFLPITYWEVPKVYSYSVFIEFFILIVVYSVFKSTLDVNFKNNGIKSSLYVFLGISILTALLGSDVIKSFYGNYYRADGLVMLSQLIGFSVILGSIFKQKWNLVIASSIYFASLISAIWSNFGQVNYLVGFILISAPFGIYCYLKSTKNIVKMAIIFSFIVHVKTIIQAESYVGLLGLLLLPILFVAVNNKKFIKYLVVPVIALVTVFIGIWLREISSHKEYVAESRIRIYRNVFLGSLERPLQGYGWSNTDYAFESIEWPIKFNNDIYVDKAHMLILDIFSNTGVFGLIAYLLFLLLLFKRLDKENSLFTRILTLSLVMHFIYSQTNLTSISEEFIFWVIVGITLSL